MAWEQTAGFVPLGPCFGGGGRGGNSAAYDVWPMLHCCSENAGYAAVACSGMAKLGRLVDLQLPIYSAIGCPNID